MIGIIVFMSFFVRFLVFELLSNFYFTVVNSDLDLSVAWLCDIRHCAVDASLFQLGSQS